MKSLKVLCVGNSFSCDMVEHSLQIAQSLGYENVVVGNLYIGGCSLATHLGHSKENDAAYRFFLNNNGEFSDNASTLLEGITYTDWDVITFQQASHYSGLSETYHANLLELIDYVKAHSTNKNVKFYWHMTWAYDHDSTHEKFYWYKNDTRFMYESIANTVKDQIVPNKDFSGIIKNGLAMQIMREKYGHINMTRDGFHASNPLGFYVLDTNFISVITGEDVLNIKWKPENISDAEAETVRNAVKEAQETIL